MVRVTRRGQLVLLAAVLVAVAIVPMVLAYLQLSYHVDVEAGGAHDDPTADARSVLVRAVHQAREDVPGQYSWARRSAAVRTVEARLEPRIATVETARVEEGIYRNVSYNQTLAERWENANCPSEFGPCEAHDGIVVQERAGRTHVLAIAFDLETTGQHQRTELSTVVGRLT